MKSSSPGPEKALVKSLSLYYRSLKGKLVLHLIINQYKAIETMYVFYSTCGIILQIVNMNKVFVLTLAKISMWVTDLCWLWTLTESMVQQQDSISWCGGGQTHYVVVFFLFFLLSSHLLSFYSFFSLIYNSSFCWTIFYQNRL